MMRIVYTESTYKRAIISAVISIALGLVLVIWPKHVLDYTVKLIGVVFCIIGAISLVASIRENRNRSTGLVSVTGVGSILLGLLLWFMSNSLTNLLMYLLGFILLFIGIAQIALFLSTRRYGKLPWISYIFPVVVLIVGFLILAYPFEAKETIIMIFGYTLIFYGITDVINQRNINRMRQQERDDEQQKRLGTTDIEDTSYEEL